jgi:acyl-coenzyme A thioesterase PaaI-like protein
MIAGKHEEINIVKKLQPNSRDCFACGLSNKIGLKIRFYNIRPGEVEASYTVDEVYQGYPGIVHGGIVAAMLDEISYRSLIVDDPQRLMFTARLNIRYRENVPVNQPLRLVGKAGKVKSRTASASGYIYGPDSKLLAEAEALLVRVPKEMYKPEGYEALGWKVYSENEIIST